MARKERRRLGLDGRVLLSHNFSHHFEIPEDVVDRMSPRGRKALATLHRRPGRAGAVAVHGSDGGRARPPSAGTRLPTADEVAEALRMHERDFRGEHPRSGAGAAAGADPAASRG